MVDEQLLWVRVQHLDDWGTEVGLESLGDASRLPSDWERWSERG